MTKRLISTGSPFEQTLGYSRAVVQDDHLWVAGITGLDYATMTMPEGVAEQAENCFKTLQGVLDEADFTMNDIVRVTHYFDSRDHIDAAIPVLGKYLGDIRPAATLVVAGLFKPEMLYEVEVTAFKG